MTDDRGPGGPHARRAPEPDPTDSTLVESMRRNLRETRNRYRAAMLLSEIAERVETRGDRPGAIAAESIRRAAKGHLDTAAQAVESAIAAAEVIRRRQDQN